MTEKLSASASSFSTKLPATIAHDVSLILEQYPNVGKKIAQLWGSVDLHNYLNSVVFDERGGRHGFPENIVSALFRVSEAHKTLVPEKNGGDIWDIILGQVK